MEPIRIELPIRDNESRRNTVRTACYLLLFDNHLDYKAICKYEELKEKSGIWEPDRANYRWCRKRKDMTHVEMWIDNVEEVEVYFVAIGFGGEAAPTASWTFDEPKQALVVYTQLREYYLEENAV